MNDAEFRRMTDELVSALKKGSIFGMGDGSDPDWRAMYEQAYWGDDPQTYQFGDGVTQGTWVEVDRPALRLNAVQRRDGTWYVPKRITSKSLNAT